MEKIKGIICNYKGGKSTRIFNELIIKIENFENLDNLAGKTVIYEWNTKKGKKEIRGKILRKYGKDKVIARFRRGLPGDALGKEVTIIV